MQKPIIETTFEFSGKYVLTRFEGPIDYKTILFGFDRVVNSSQYRNGMARIWELTAADLSPLSDENIWMSANYPSIFPSGINNVKEALVSENKDNSEVLHRFKSYSVDLKTDVQIFESLQAAIEWVLIKK
jgi:hypothetical protein